MGRSLLLLLGILALFSWIPAEGINDSIGEALEGIRASELESVVRFLSADEMGGRQVSSRFNKITSQYLAHRFELMGLEPFSPEGYFQYFQLVRGRLAGTNSLQLRQTDSPLPHSAVIHDDFVPSILSDSSRVRAPLVLAGYGITAPEYGYDDYLGLDAKGRIVLAFDQEPGRRNPDSPFAGQLDSQFSGERHKAMNAQAHGAVGLMIVHDSPSSPTAQSFSSRARRSWPDESSRSPYTLEVWTEKIRIPVLRISRQLAQSILDRVGQDLQQIQEAIDQDFQPRSMNLFETEASIETTIYRERSPVRNVIAKLQGSDPTLMHQFVIIGAHFDHVGSDDEKIFNGADDNASGTAGLLEIAQAYSQAKQKPKRSLLFAAWNAEEKGLLGSYYFVESPPFPLQQTAAVLQMDMIGRNEDIPHQDSLRFLGLPAQKAENNTNSLHLLGYSRSDDLRRLVLAQNRLIELDLKMEYDNNASNLLRRSDNWPFLISGVPSLFFHTGLHPDYHRPTDTADKINFTKMEKIVRLVFLCSWEIARSEVRPTLNVP